MADNPRPAGMDSPSRNIRECEVVTAEPGFEPRAKLGGNEFGNGAGGAAVATSMTPESGEADEEMVG